MAAAEACVDLDDVLTIKDTHALFKRHPERLRAHPGDLVVAFHMAFLAYHEPVVRAGLFGPDAGFRVHVRSAGPARRGGGRSAGPFVFVVEHRASGALYVAVRGSATASDLWTNLKRGAVRSRRAYPPVLVAALGEAALRAYGEDVHAGFFEHALGALALVWDLLAPLRGRPEAVHFYGHSLGGACAVVLADVLAGHGFRTRCCCMSCPPPFKRARTLATRLRLDASTYVHYFSRGDVFVALPRAFRLHHPPFGDVELPPVRFAAGSALRNTHRVFAGATRVLGSRRRRVVLSMPQWTDLALCQALPASRPPAKP
jgi:hypothetical protein